jgi:hypothetical protein
VAALFALSGCVELFTYNAFGSLDQPDIPVSGAEVTEIVEAAEDTQSLIDTIAELADSSAFYESIADQSAEDAEVVATITTALADVYESTDETVTQQQKQEAAVLAAEIFLKSNVEAEEAVDSVLVAAFDLMPAEGEPAPTLEDAVAVILDNAFAAVEDLDATLTSLENAAAAYEAFGLALEALPAYRDVRVAAITDQISDAINFEDAAIKALFSIAVKTFLAVYDDVINPGVVGDRPTLEDIIEIATNPAVSPNNTILLNTADELLANNNFMNILRATPGIDQLLDSFGIVIPE